jgi:hypothetical protein
MTVGFTEKKSLVPGAIAICHKTGADVSQMELSCTRLGKLLVQDRGRSALEQAIRSILYQIWSIPGTRRGGV